MVPILASGLGLQVGVNLLTSLAQRVLAPEDPSDTFAAALRAQTAAGAQSSAPSKGARVSLADRGAGVTIVSSASTLRIASDAYRKLGSSQPV